ncbi:MAG: 50S ribosomal protein L24 [Parcubacteria group bacterium CG1_02_37_51]|uniref:Large ribosomal subunit protein uL24 n=2 Tax=Candidatus Komeiliibacteriota TaxID=1817908 RepID=A0A2M8DRM1_9BACT|nr:MAG: 50S ribosomal protein L24 [Parcubacteria group bacterium CG1_02_37_51]PIY94820.1 MAG: 50S ribosomal protein L24 [Candidatus Komeilibacteria bacterium CG_4_10_14_0_8_um_filter_37_78]PJC01988.1 MAG: 50S ribosomal protein L24 [Candidatus Komeilibacteria bacterium CG_4_9_14_0_8_um_filter_36_9]
MRIKKGDNVEIIAGKDKGKRGKVIRVNAVNDQVVVEGANLRIKHTRPKRDGEKGQRIEFPAALHVSNVMAIDPSSSKRTRIGYQCLADGKKIRISKKSKQEL